MRVHDAILNAYFIALCILFVTGGTLPQDGAPHGNLLVEASQLGPWVAGLLALTALRYLRDRDRPLTEIPFVRWLAAVGGRLSTSPVPMYVKLRDEDGILVFRKRI
jgi:hypothetical protein